VDLAPGHLPLAVIYGLGYATVVLLLACWAFERKDFN